MSINVAATDDQKVAKIALTVDGQQVAISYGASLTRVFLPLRVQSANLIRAIKGVLPPTAGEERSRRRGS